MSKSFNEAKYVKHFADEVQLCPAHGLTSHPERTRGRCHECCAELLEVLDRFRELKH